MESAIQCQTYTIYAVIGLDDGSNGKNESGKKRLMTRD